MMKIKTHNLIGERHDVKIPKDIPALQIYGVNGSGKSLFLKAVYHLLNNEFRLASEVPFERITVEFDTKTFVFHNNRGVVITATDGDGNVLESPIDFPVNVTYYEPDMIYYETIDFPRHCDEDKRCNIFKEVVNQFLLHKKVDYLRPLRFKFANGDILKFSQLSHGE